MAFSCTQSNKPAAKDNKENAKTTSEKKSEFPDVTAENKENSKQPEVTTAPTVATKSPKEAQETTTTTPPGYSEKEKEVTTTESKDAKTKRETATPNLNGPKLFAFNEQFGLRLNESATNEASSTALEVLAIRDNRCPVGVNCFRAGEVEVELKINDKETVTLTFPTAEKPRSQDAYATDQFTVKLLGASRKGRPNLSKPEGGLLKNSLGGIEVYLKVVQK